MPNSCGGTYINRMTKNQNVTVPHLTTALTGPLENLEPVILNNQTKIESSFRNTWREVRGPFYASVDIRNAGYKIAPVDTNLFPSGFNNLNPSFESLCIHAVQMAVEHIGLPVDKILIIPEKHTRNLFYMENIASLQSIIQKAGFEVRVGTLMDDINNPISIELNSSKTILLEPLRRDQNRLLVDNFDPDLILLNNDLSGGEPEIFKDVIDKVVAINDHKDRKRALSEPCVVISPAGMLVGGNAVYYLQQLAFDERNGIALVSYQGEGTPGKKLLETGKISTRGKDLNVVAQVKQFQFSGHADRDSLFEMVKKIKGDPKVLTVHGDNQSCTRFAEEIHEKFGLDAHAPAIDETISI